MASLFKRRRADASTEKPRDDSTVGSGSEAEKPVGLEDGPVHLFSVRVISMALIVSLGGFIFGFDTGQISGFLEMNDFRSRFGNVPQPNGQPNAFTNVREGTIVGLLSIGTLCGALCAGPLADITGRKLSIVLWNLLFCVGMIVQISTQFTWYQIALGRWVSGIGVGGLSVLTPMYQSETAPKQIRGALISCYQLFITAGIWVAGMINYGTEKIDGPASWRITLGISFIPSVVMAVGIMFLPETPRYQFRKGKIEDATSTISKSYGVSENHTQVRRELREIQLKLEAERADSKWYEIFTGPKMAYRTLLGITLQSLQQLTGANFFFYYGTTVFDNVGIPNSFVTSVILSGINFGSTFFGLWVVENVGRRRALLWGAGWMSICFFIFASVGHFQLQPRIDLNAALGADVYDVHTPGIVMIIFTCLFIFGYAITWGPIVWALVAEIYPSKYRGRCLSMATSANWIWNFLIAFFTPFITGNIDYAYGYVFGGCNVAAVIIVYLFVFESSNKTLEEIDTMYCSGVKAWNSSKWNPPLEELEQSGAMQGQPGADGRYKRTEASGVGAQQSENVLAPHAGPSVV